jgi:hypothetical protein
MDNNNKINLEYHCITCNINLTDNDIDECIQCEICYGSLCKKCEDEVLIVEIKALESKDVCENCCWKIFNELKEKLGQ